MGPYCPKNPPWNTLEHSFIAANPDTPVACPSCLERGLLVGGVAYLDEIEATDGVTTISRKGGLYPNLEAGLRFLFI